MERGWWVFLLIRFLKLSSKLLTKCRVTSCLVRSVWLSYIVFNLSTSKIQSRPKMFKAVNCICRLPLMQALDWIFNTFLKQFQCINMSLIQCFWGLPWRILSYFNHSHWLFLFGIYFLIGWTSIHHLAWFQRISSDNKTFYFTGRLISQKELRYNQQPKLTKPYSFNCLPL